MQGHIVKTVKIIGIVLRSGRDFWDGDIQKSVRLDRVGRI